MSRLCEEILSAFERKNPKKLRKLHKRLLKDASLNSSKKTVELAVLTYVLSKVCSKTRFQTQEMRPYQKDILEAMYALCEADNDNKRWWAALKKVEDNILSLDDRDRRYVLSLMDKGRLKAAATLYAQGFSLGRASDYVGVPKQEILAYVGKTMMFDRVKEEISAVHRFKRFRHYVEG